MPTIHKAQFVTYRNDKKWHKLTDPCLQTLVEPNSRGLVFTHHSESFKSIIMIDYEMFPKGTRRMSRPKTTLGAICKTSKALQTICFLYLCTGYQSLITDRLPTSSIPNGTATICLIRVTRFFCLLGHCLLWPLL